MPLGMLAHRKMTECCEGANFDLEKVSAPLTSTGRDVTTTTLLSVEFCALIRNFAHARAQAWSVKMVLALRAHPRNNARPKLNVLLGALTQKPGPPL